MCHRRVYIIFFLLFAGIYGNIYGQRQLVEEDEHLRLIKSRLEELSDSLAPGLNEYTHFSASEMPIQLFLRGLADTHDLNINVDPKLEILVTNNFTSVLVKDLLNFLCTEYNLDIKFTSNIMSFYKFIPPTPTPVDYKPRKINIQYNPSNDLLSVDLKEDSVELFAKQLTIETGKNLILSPQINGVRLHGFVRNMPFEKALDKIAFANNLSFRKTEDNFYVFEPIQVQSPQSVSTTGLTRSVSAQTSRTNASAQGLQVDILLQGRDTLVSVDAVNVPIAEIIDKVSNEVQKNYFLYSEPTGNTTAKVKNIRYDDLLTFLLQGSTHTYKKQDNVYLIGKKGSDGFRNTKIVKLQFRSVETVETFIPQINMEGTEIKVFKELNSIIITGDEKKIEEIVVFLKELDEPVPNIMIEVIVANIKTGASIQTGLSAFLSDSVPKTSGQVFPGLDATISSGSINSFLTKLDNKGIINLGRVTPQFYVNLQALEDNNVLNVESTPKLSTLNGHEANLTIGETVYYLEQTQNITGGVTPITTVTPRYRSVEANLSITINPVVSGDGNITLSLIAEFSDFIPATIQGAPPGNATRQFNSQIRIKNEEMVVLGGLEEVSKSESGSGIPLLSRIPVLSWLFSTKSRSVSDNRLIVFIRPTIVY